MVNITRQVEQALEKSGIQEGFILINAMNITASVFINDDESGLHQDYEIWLEKLAPEKPYSQYQHNGYEDNGDAHLNALSWGGKPWLQLRKESWILEPGSRFFILNLMESGKSVC